MQCFKLSDNKILRKILSKNSSEAKQETDPCLNQACENSRRQFSHQTKKYETIFNCIFLEEKNLCSVV